MPDWERKELTELPEKIEVLEAEHTELIEKMGDPKLYQSDPDAYKALQVEVETKEQEMEQSFARWEKLEARRVEVDGA